MITGDITQIDLPSGTESGLVEAIRVLRGVEGIGFTRFNKSDVVRHPLVQSIIRAYEQIGKGSPRQNAGDADELPTRGGKSGVEHGGD